jgi:hypothetical protein
MDRLQADSKFSLLEKQANEHFETRQQLTCLKAYFLSFFLNKRLADGTVVSVRWARWY